MHLRCLFAKLTQMNQTQKDTFSMCSLFFFLFEESQVLIHKIFNSIKSKIEEVFDLLQEMNVKQLCKPCLEKCH